MNINKENHISNEPMNTSKVKLVIYTVLVGAKEYLNDPLQLIPSETTTDIDIDYFCLTDNDQLTSTTWKFRKLEVELVPIEKASRHPKAKPHDFFPEYEYSLYIDNTVVFKRLPRLADIKGKVFAAFKHPWRNNPADEADIIVKSGLDDFEVVANQLNFYSQNGMPLENIKRLTAGTVLLRKHNVNSVKIFGEHWWQQILLFSKRDQISLDICANIAKCNIEYFEGDKTQNDLFIWPVVPGSKRVLGSFDTEKYKWLNRTEPEALADPKRHFLLQNKPLEDYNRESPLFEYSCRRKGSGMSETFAPRRSLGKIIGKVITENEISFSNVMFAGISSNSKYSISPEELIQAKDSLLHYYRFSSSTPTVVTAMSHEEELSDPAPFINENEENNFDIIFLIGAPKKISTKILMKYYSLLKINGKIMIEFNESLTIQEILDMHSPIRYRGKLEIYHGHHITENNIIPNKVFVIDNNPKE